MPRATVSMLMAGSPRDGRRSCRNRSAGSRARGRRVRPPPLTTADRRVASSGGAIRVPPDVLALRDPQADGMSETATQQGDPTMSVHADDATRQSLERGTASLPD